jgi:putative hydrolase of the HAD superfamily
VFQPGIRAVFFDAVGTLIHPAPPAAEVYAEVGSRFGSRYTVPEIAPRFRAAFRRQEAGDRASSWRTNEERERRRWQQIVAEVLDDVTDPLSCFEALFEHFAQPDAWHVDPQAGATMSALALHGFRVGIASNYDSRLHRLAAGLPAHEYLLISSEVGWRKPAGEFFAAMCRRAGLQPGQIAHIGDDFDNDYEGARAAGLQAVLVDPQGKHEHCRTIRRLSDLVLGQRRIDG